MELRRLSQCSTDQAVTVIRLLAAVAGIALGWLGGLAVSRLPAKAIVQSLGALLLGWLLGSLAPAIAWLKWPPPHVDVLAISVGLHEAVITTALLAILGAGFHYALAWAGTNMHPGLAFYRTAIMGLAGGVAGALTFTVGMGGVRPGG
jgi:hypothetical protein